MDRIKHIGLVMFGGIGERFGSALPKQFVDCGGRPLMAETLLNISSFRCIDELYVITHPDYIDDTNTLIDDYVPNLIHGVIPGGDTRHDSVSNALEYLEELGIEETSIIAIFDGDRPGIEESIVYENFEMAERYGAAVTALPSTDSVFQSTNGGEVSSYLDRKTIFLAQTPQTFRFDIILDAYKICQNPSTDDASLLAEMGRNVHIVIGNKENEKITYPLDMVRYLAKRR